LAAQLKTKSYRAFAFLAVVLLATIFMAPPALAENVRAIKIEGNQRIEPATVLSYINVQAGDPFDAELLNNALKSLYGTGMFADVSLYQEGSDLVIVVVENPIINEIRFEGNDKLKDENLLSEVQLRPRTVLTRTKVQTDVERLQELYRLSGRFSAVVDPKIIKLDQNRVNLVFEINEGPTTYISRIRFIGNNQFDDDDLQKVLRSKEDRWWRLWSGDDKYDPDRLDYDRELLRKFYLDNGYADFYVENAVAELSPDRENFYVTFLLNEGIRYKVGDVRIESNIPDLKADSLKSVVTFEKGEWYQASAIEKTIADMTEELSNRQFPFTEIRPAVDRKRDSGVIDIVFTVNPGKKLFVGNINVNGNVRTLDEVIRREMTLYEGDPFNGTRLKQSEQRLRDLAFFEKAEAKPVPGAAPDTVDIDVMVSEKSTGELSIGGGYSTTDGALADFRIKEKNFLGKGQELLFATTLAARRTEFDFSFTEPYFLKRDLSAGVDLFHITRDYQDESSYDSRRTGAGLRLGYPLSEHWRQSLSYRFENNEITNVPATASVYIRQQAGKRATSALAQRLSYDTTDSRLEPTEGVRARIDTEIAGLGGDANYFKTKVGGNYYVSLKEKWVLSLLGEAGYIFGLGDTKVRINERFYIGGDTLRGFQDGGIGPRDTLTGDALGGNRFWRGSVELGLPSGLPEDLGVRLHAFSDFGALWTLDSAGPNIKDDSMMRASAGLGASWASPMGPLRADFATPLVKEDDDETEVFRISFGTRF
jgi:outer membrane protein insertion porin family